LLLCPKRLEEKTVTYENYIKAMLVHFAVGEAYHEGSSISVLAIAQVLKNRVDAGWGDWMHVIETAPNYAGTVRERPKVDPQDVMFRKILLGIDDIYYGIADDGDVNNDEFRSLYYAELHNINRAWFLENVLNDLESHPRVAKVGQIDFFA
jgi:hypothetical protein